MWDFLSFRRMLIPYLVQILFWCGTAFCIFNGVMVMMGKATSFIPWRGVQPGNRVLEGAIILLGGPIVLRLLCENFVVIFRINETLTEMSGSRGGKK